MFGGEGVCVEVIDGSTTFTPSHDTVIRIITSAFSGRGFGMGRDNALFSFPIEAIGTAIRITFPQYGGNGLWTYQGIDYPYATNMIGPPRVTWVSTTTVET